MSPSVCEGGSDVGFSGTGSALNARWCSRCYILMETTLGNRRRERIKTKGIMEMGQVSRETSLLCLFSYLRLSEKEKARGWSADSEWGEQL